MAFKPKVDKVELENTDSDIIAVVDADWPVYSVASVGDEDYIEVTHNESGTVQEFKNKTEFYGRSSKTIGGWLAERNGKRAEKGLPLYAVEDFTIEQKKRRKVEYDASGDPKPQHEADKNILHSARVMIVACLNQLKASDYKCFHGGSGTYRRDASTLLEYKANRKDMEKPLMFEEVKEYIAKRFKSEAVEGAIETDDKVVMEAYKKPNHVVVGVDKDFRGQPIKFFDANHPEEGIIDGDCFGVIEWVKEKSKATGRGRLFLYWQTLCGDDVDNYKTNCFSDIKWGAKSAFDALVKCKNDEQAWKVLVQCLKDLYPKPIKAEGWRGAVIKVNWLYVLKEMFTLARMIRFSGDEKTTMEDWMKELGLKPEEILK